MGTRVVGVTVGLLLAVCLVTALGANPSPQMQAAPQVRLQFELSTRSASNPREEPEILARPAVLTGSEEIATIQVGEEVPFISLEGTTRRLGTGLKLIV